MAVTLPDPRSMQPWLANSRRALFPAPETGKSAGRSSMLRRQFVRWCGGSPRAPQVAVGWTRSITSSTWAFAAEWYKSIMHTLARFSRYRAAILRDVTSRQSKPRNAISICTAWSFPRRRHESMAARCTSGFVTADFRHSAVIRAMATSMAFVMARIDL